MNRKVATIIIMVVFVLSLVVVSLIGKEGGDFAVNREVDSIVIVDAQGNSLETTNIGGKEMVELVVDLSADINKTYTFYYQVNPSNANISEVDFIIDSQYEDKISIVGGGGFYGSAIITFLTGEMPSEGFVVTVKATDGSEKSASVSFIKKQVSEGSTDL